jgi:hypothetical protein
MSYPSLSMSAFADHLNTIFTVMVEGDQTVTLTLAEVKSHGTRETGDLTIESFSLIFEGPTSPMLSQSSFEFVHDHLGEFFIFIVPLGPRRGVMVYEAVFN